MLISLHHIPIPSSYDIEVDTMALTGTGKIHEPVKGRIMIYIPSDVHKDSTFPFNPKEEVKVTIVKGKLVIEKI